MTLTTLKKLARASGYDARRVGKDAAILDAGRIVPETIRETPSACYQAFCAYRLEKQITRRTVQDDAEIAAATQQSTSAYCDRVGGI